MLHYLSFKVLHSFMPSTWAFDLKRLITKDDIVVHQVTLPPVMLVPHIRPPYAIPAVPFLNQLLAHVFRKVEEVKPSTWASVTHMREQDESFWLFASAWPGLAIVATWGMNQKMEDTSLFLPLCHSTFKINTSFKKLF